jgi:hypothetical protein
MFQVLDQIKQLIHCFVLSGRTMLADNDMDHYAGMDARQNAADVANWQRFDDCQGTMLAVGRISAPPDHGKYLTGAEVVNSTSVPTQLAADWITEAQTIGH